MTDRNFTALSALALGLVIAASAASAQPYGKGGASATTNERRLVEK